MDLKNSLLQVGQDHLLEGIDSLSEAERLQLEKEIASQDFHLLNQLFKEHSSKPIISTDDEILPITFDLAENNIKQDMWEETGFLLLEQGQVAAFLVAGGQGSRLGFEGPKGAYDIGLPSKKSLFQIQAERISNLSARAGHPIPWCIMTSPLNHEDTIAHFESHHFFGLPRDSIRFFSQGTMCALDPNGKAIKSSKGHLALVPDGNGGCFRALAQSGTLAWLIEKGVRYVFLYSVDNVLVKVADPAFVGALASDGRALSSSKVVRKKHPQEKVGVFVIKNKKPSVIEYSDLPEDLRSETYPDGSPLYDGANIAIHLFRIDALKKLQNTPLPWHSAKKTVFGVNNAWKFEQFLFDAFPLLGSMTLYGVSREDEFAPVKNADGDDSPKSARVMLGSLHKYWLERAGVSVDPRKLYEISPTISYSGESLSQTVFDRELGKNILAFDP